MARQHSEKAPVTFFMRHFSALALLGITFAGTASAATYRPANWLVSGSFSYGVLDPKELNAAINGPDIPGLIGFHLQGERTLRTPDITHWVEVSYGIGVAAGSSGTVEHENSLTYLSIIPIGATYWFNRTAYIDFGVGLGLGLGLSPSLTSVKKTSSTTETTEYTGGAGILAEGRLTGRFWFSRYISLTCNGGLRIYSTTLQAPSKSDINASLVSLTGTFGVTWAIGGTTGLGRTFVEVLPPEKRAPKRKTQQDSKPTKDTAP